MFVLEDAAWRQSSSVFFVFRFLAGGKGIHESSKVYRENPEKGANSTLTHS